MHTKTMARIPMETGPGAPTLADLVHDQLAMTGALHRQSPSLAQELSGVVEHDPELPDVVLDWAAQIRAEGFTWAEAMSVASVLYYG
jgi:hypothetical protein